jgi:hypothetical protein
VVEAVDRFDRELVGDQFVHERQGVVGRVRSVVVGGADLVAIRAADAVAVVTIGDQDVIGTDLVGDRPDPLRIGDALDDVLDSVDGDRCHRFARFGRAVP